jgi:hypothetical protein
LLRVVTRVVFKGLVTWVAQRLLLKELVTRIAQRSGDKGCYSRNCSKDWCYSRNCSKNW